MGGVLLVPVNVLELEPGSVHASEHGQPGPEPQQAGLAAGPCMPMGCPELGKGATPSCLPVTNKDLMSKECNEIMLLNGKAQCKKDLYVLKCSKTRKKNMPVYFEGHSFKKSCSIILRNIF